MSSFCQELIKLALQVFGALMVTWVTVRLALRRFKSERRWERQTSTLADLLIVIDELDRINEILLRAERTHLTLSEERQNKFSEDWGKAMRDFEKGAAVAAVLLPSDLFAIIKQLRSDLKAPSPMGDFASKMESDAMALGRARQSLIDAGRKLQTQ